MATEFWLNNLLHLFSEGRRSFTLFCIWPQNCNLVVLRADFSESETNSEGNGERKNSQFAASTLFSGGNWTGMGNKVFFYLLSWTNRKRMPKQSTNSVKLKISWFNWYSFILFIFWACHIVWVLGMKTHLFLEGGRGEQ